MRIGAVVLMVVTMFMRVVMPVILDFVIVAFMVMSFMVVTFVMIVLAILGIAAQCHVTCVQQFQLWRTGAAGVCCPIQPRRQLRAEPDQKPGRLQRLRIGRSHLVMMDAGA